MKICITGDLHAGSTVAGCPPVVDLDDGDAYHASKSQRWIWDNWLKYCEQAAGADVAILNGDIVEGDAKDRSYQVITRNRATIKRVACAVIEPLANAADRIYFVRGTPAHGGKSSEIEESIAEDFDNTVKDGKNYSWPRLSVLAERVRLDVAHTATMGGQPWSKRMAAERLANRILYEYAERDEPMPDLVIRSHCHQWSKGGNRRVYCMYIPGWTFATEYINQINQGAQAEIGGIILHVDGKHYEIERFEPEPLKRVWVKL
mgnify:CR=1 FL=1